MKRIPTRELLDDDAGTPSEVAASLADLRFLNRYFGGVATTTHMIQCVARATGRRDFSMLEAAAGSGELPQTVRARLQPAGINLRLIMLDRLFSHLGAQGPSGLAATTCAGSSGAQGPPGLAARTWAGSSEDGKNKVVGDALALPFRDASFDLISCCLFVHHLAPELVSAFVKEALRCSRVAVLINDLIRHPVHWAMAHTGRLIYRSRITVNDAPASVRQSYTTEEMRAMLEQSGAAAVDISTHYFYRMGAIVWKMPAANGRARPYV